MNEKHIEALKLALEALAASDDFLFNYHDCEPNNEREVDAYSEVRGNNMKAWEAIREALAEQPAQQQKEGFASPGGGYVPAIPRPMPLDWKLVPRKATPEMLKAMDECAQEGYDERLYAGMASSVYMAAWDASPVMGTLPEQPAQQQEPVEWDGRCVLGHCGSPTGCELSNYCRADCTSPPASKPWVGLTHDEVNSWELPNCPTVFEFAQFIEAKLREKNA